MSAFTLGIIVLAGSVGSVLALFAVITLMMGTKEPRDNDEN